MRRRLLPATILTDVLSVDEVDRVERVLICVSTRSFTVMVGPEIDQRNDTPRAGVLGKECDRILG